MKIAVAHSFYRSDAPSGENIAVEQEVEVLRRFGHEVVLHSVSSDDMRPGRSGEIMAGIRVLTGSEPAPWANMIERSYDMVHVHNTFPNWSARGLKSLVDVVPVIRTVHNYRSFCSAGTLARPGVPRCSDCSDKTPLAAIRHRCYRNSVVSTIPVALSRKFARDEWLTVPSHLVALTGAMKDFLVNSGVGAERISVVPNFVKDTFGPNHVTFADRSGDWCFVGRLVPEKGILSILQSWPRGVGLTIVGSGPLESEVRRLALLKGLDMRGRLSPDETQQVIARSRGLVFGSEWREGLPLVYLEACMSGTPVVCLEGSDLASVVEVDGSGIVVERAMLTETVGSLSDAKLEQYAAAARLAYDTRYNESSFVESVCALGRSH